MAPLSGFSRGGLSKRFCRGSQLHSAVSSWRVASLLPSQGPDRFLPTGDGQVGRRYAAHNEPVAMYVHEQLTPVVGDIAGTALKPSYAYFVAYQSGSRLERHTDRPQCEYSVTLLIDSTPEPGEQSPWPIKLDTSRGTVAIWQYLGEALLYRGRRLPHHRDRLPQGCSSTSLLLHYVDRRFTGPLG